MKLKFIDLITVAICGVMVSSIAKAAVVTFVGTPAATFAGGTFSTHLSAKWEDGFSHFGGTRAFNAFGQNGEKIFFTTPVELNSLSLSPLPLTLLEGTSNNSSPATITVRLFDSKNNQLASQTLSPFGTLTFNEKGVSTVEFDFTGGTYNVYGDGRTVAFYVLSDVTYTVSAAPQP